MPINSNYSVPLKQKRKRLKEKKNWKIRYLENLMYARKCFGFTKYDLAIIVFRCESTSIFHKITNKQTLCSTWGFWTIPLLLEDVFTQCLSIHMFQQWLRHVYTRHEKTQRHQRNASVGLVKKHESQNVIFCKGGCHCTLYN